MSRERLWRRGVLGIVALVIAASPVTAGVVYEIEVKDHEQSPPKTESIQAAVEGRHLKMGIASKGKGAQGEMIFRGDRREMIVVDHQHKTYHQIDDEMMKQIAGQLDAVSAQMEEALKNVPEDQRAMIEKMMKQKMPAQAQKKERPKSQLKKIGDGGKQNGYPCTKYEVWDQGKRTRELWVTDWSNVDGGSDMVDAFEDMADFFSDLMDSIPDMGQGRSRIGDSTLEHMRELGGFPVLTKEYGDDGSLEGETALRSSKRQTVDPDAFEPPAGYKRQEMLGGR